MYVHCRMWVCPKKREGERLKEIMVKKENTLKSYTQQSICPTLYTCTHFPNKMLSHMHYWIAS